MKKKSKPTKLPLDVLVLSLVRGGHSQIDPIGGSAIVSKAC